MALASVLVLAATTLRLEGDVVDDGQDYVLVDFEVPAGIVELEIAHTDGDAGDVLDWGLWGPEGFRGYGGGLEDSAIVGEDAASRGYLPGMITPGTWSVLVGKAKLESGGAHYVIDVTMRDVATLPSDAALRAPWQPVVVETGARWYAGDLHVHSRESGDADASFAEIHTLARQQGLDWVVISDHNTVAHHQLLPVFQAGVDDLLFVRGVEITTYAGHGNGVGTSALVDWRVGLGGRTAADLVNDVAAQGGFFVINHPTLELGTVCIGCDWKHEDIPWAMVGGVEIQTGPFAATGGIFTPQAIALWDQQLAEGHRITAVGGSDDHRAGEDLGMFGSPIGAPTTLVWAEELSEAGVLAALRAGRAVVKLRGPGDPMLELTSGAAMVGDDVTAPAGGALPLAVKVTGGGAGQEVALYRDGQLVEQRAIAGDPFETVFEVEAPAEGAAARWRATVYDSAAGLDVVVTNHIFVTGGPRQDSGGGCGCRTGGEGDGGGGILVLLGAAAICRRLRRAPAPQACGSALGSAPKPAEWRADRVARPMLNQGTMPHVFHALFPRAGAAAEALREIRQVKQHDFHDAQLHVSLQRHHLDSEKLPLGTTNGGYRFLFGIGTGAILGALAGWLLMGIGVIEVADPTLALFLTGMLGAIVGGLGGALSGVASPDAALDDLTKNMHQGDVAVSFEMTDADFVARAAAICQQHGARVELRKHALVV